MRTPHVSVESPPMCVSPMSRNPIGPKCWLVTHALPLRGDVHVPPPALTVLPSEVVRSTLEALVTVTAYIRYLLVGAIAAVGEPIGARGRPAVERRRANLRQAVEGRAPRRRARSIHDRWGPTSTGCRIAGSEVWTAGDRRIPAMSEQFPHEGRGAQVRRRSRCVLRRSRGHVRAHRGRRAGGSRSRGGAGRTA